MSSSKDDEGKEKVALTDAQRARIERNRQRALLLRQARLANSPYNKTERAVVHVTGSKLVDSGGGFFLEENNEDDSAKKAVDSRPAAFEPTLHLCGADRPSCRDCAKQFSSSYLLMNFDEPVCDACRLEFEKYELITKTEAKEAFLLKDCDLEKREPTLRFIMKKNPHSTYGQMHLYLKSQVEARAFEVWESMERLEEEKVNRTEKKEKLRRKKFNQKVQELRKSVRSSLWQKKNTTHEHEYGPENYNEDEDNYYKVCTSCGHNLSYEKM